MTQGNDIGGSIFRSRKIKKANTSICTDRKNLNDIYGLAELEREMRRVMAQPEERQ